MSLLEKLKEKLTECRRAGKKQDQPVPANGCRESRHEVMQICEQHPKIKTVDPQVGRTHVGERVEGPSKIAETQRQASYE